jgi:hypothetical protein
MDLRPKDKRIIVTGASKSIEWPITSLLTQ